MARTTWCAFMLVHSMAAAAGGSPLMLAIKCAYVGGSLVWARPSSMVGICWSDPGHTMYNSLRASSDSGLSWTVRGLILVLLSARSILKLQSSLRSAHLQLGSCLAFSNPRNSWRRAVQVSLLSKHEASRRREELGCCQGACHHQTICHVCIDRKTTSCVARHNQ